MIEGARHGLTIVSNGCFSKGCSAPPHLVHTFSGPCTTALGNNQTPDDLSGQIVFSATSGTTSNGFSAETRTAFVGVAEVRAFSGVSPAPEAATYLLLGAGLLRVGAMARRRLRG